MRVYHYEDVSFAATRAAISNVECPLLDHVKKDQEDNLRTRSLDGDTGFGDLGKSFQLLNHGGFRLTYSAGIDR